MNSEQTIHENDMLSDNHSSYQKDTIIPKLDPKSWITLLLSGVKIEAIVHSHPEETGLSDIDIKAAQFLAIPYMVVQLPSGKETWTNK